MIRLSILHPSYGRPEMAFNACKEWLQNCHNPLEVEYIIGLDENDSLNAEYGIRFFTSKSIQEKWGKFEIDTGNSTCAVQALNRITLTISDASELLIEVLDDVGCFQDWDLALWKLLENIDNFKEPKMIGTHDGL